MLREIEFAFSGENVDISSLPTRSAHPKWGLGKVPIFPFELYKMTQVRQPCACATHERRSAAVWRTVGSLLW